MIVNQKYKIILQDNTIKLNGQFLGINSDLSNQVILSNTLKNRFIISLPVIKKNFQMDFYKWTFSDPLKVNKYGIPEPEFRNIVYPDILLIPLVGFDKNLNRLGYGGGYYDRLIEKLSKKKNIIKIGLALSIQKIDKVPTNVYDKKLDYIVTNKYIVK